MRDFHGAGIRAFPSPPILNQSCTLPLLWHTGLPLSSPSTSTGLVTGSLPHNGRQIKYQQINSLPQKDADILAPSISECDCFKTHPGFVLIRYYGETWKHENDCHKGRNLSAQIPGERRHVVPLWASPEAEGTRGNIDKLYCGFYVQEQERQS